MISLNVISLLLLEQKTHFEKNGLQGRIKEFWGGGRGFFFPKAWGLGAALRPPMGPTMGPPMGNSLMGTQGAKPPEAPEF